MAAGRKEWSTEKAKTACQSTTGMAENHFPDVRKMVSIGSDATRLHSHVYNSILCHANESL